VAVFVLVVVVTAAADCFGGNGPVQMWKTINRAWSAILFAGVIVMKGEFIVVSYRLITHLDPFLVCFTPSQCNYHDR
jgi:hypothetical protein